MKMLKVLLSAVLTAVLGIFLDFYFEKKFKILDFFGLGNETKIGHVSSIKTVYEISAQNSNDGNMHNYSNPNGNAIAEDSEVIMQVNNENDIEALEPDQVSENESELDKGGLEQKANSNNSVVIKSNEIPELQVNYVPRIFIVRDKKLESNLNLKPIDDVTFQKLLIPLKSAIKANRLEISVSILEDVSCLSSLQALNIVKLLNTSDVPEFVSIVCSFVIDIENLGTVGEYAFHTKTEEIQKFILNEKKIRNTQRKY